MVIHELPLQVANQIAAGEVVERPASVVKELIENAVDAGATDIEIQVEEAGLKRIQIIDNGIGMNPDDAVLAFKRHATSKIFSSNDLFRIRTLGFRGEALPSIASVSEITLETSDGQSGTYIYSQAGEIIDNHLHHLRQGTSVTVENIFYNTPARLKYLKSMATELSHITDIIHREAIGQPKIRFQFYSDGKLIFETNGKGRLKEVMAAIYNYREVRDMIDISGENLDFELQGLVTPPSITRSNKKHMSIYLNGRYIKNFVLNKAILTGYGSKLMIGRYPIAVLNITLDPQLLDVNVHPTKQEVRISKEDDLYELVKQAIAESLAPVQRIPEALADFKQENTEASAAIFGRDIKGEQTHFNFESLNTSNADHQNTDKESKLVDGDFNLRDSQVSHYPPHPVTAAPPSFLAEVVEEATIESGPRAEDGQSLASQSREYMETSEADTIPDAHNLGVWDTVAKVAAADEKEAARNQTFPPLDYIGQMHGTYLITSNETGMYLIDQHAAQERIKYEYFRATIAEHGTAMQELLIPYVLEYTQAEMQQIQQILPKLKTMGIELEPFGTKSFILNRHPIWMGTNAVARIVENLIELALVDIHASVAQYREVTAIMMSCKRSIKANHYLSEDQAKRLLIDLAKTENPYNCPHGRPVLIHFSNYEIERMFKRIQDPHSSQQI